MHGAPTAKFSDAVVLLVLRKSFVNKVNVVIIEFVIEIGGGGGGEVVKVGSWKYGGMWRGTVQIPFVDRFYGEHFIVWRCWRFVRRNVAWCATHVAGEASTSQVFCVYSTVYIHKLYVCVCVFVYVFAHVP